MKTLLKVLETITEKLLMASGYITSITIILMVVFLFREGAGLFNTPDIEEGYVLAVNRENPVQKLSPQQVMQVFDGDIASWGTLGWGGGDSIRLFRLDDITAYATPEELGEKLENVPQCLSRIVASHKNIIAYLPKQLIAEDFAGRILDEGKITPASFLGGKLWYPTAQPAPQFGVLPLILGTLWVSIAAILIALPFGLAVAIYMAGTGRPPAAQPAQTGHRTAGRHSVRRLRLLRTGRDRPARARTFSLSVGETGLAGAVILAIMALPTIITVAEDAIRNTPRAMKESSLALGATHWQTIRKVVIPYSISGITAAVVLGIGRALGETMAVLMVTGNAAVMPHTLLEPLRTIPATIAAELGEAPAGGAHYEALFLLGCILFLLTLVISISVEMINAKRPKQSV